MAEEIEDYPGTARLQIKPSRQNGGIDIAILQGLKISLVVVKPKTALQWIGKIADHIGLSNIDQ